jgi:hypothetical protein
VRLRLLALATMFGTLTTGCVIQSQRTVVVHENPRRPVERPDTTTPAPAPGTFEPVAVGVAFDGVLRADGTLGTYYFDPGTGTVEAKPAVMFAFAGEGFFDGSDEDAICWAFGTFSPPPLVDGAFETVDGAPMHTAFEDTVTLEQHDCAGKVDPAVWGENAEALYGPFDGARVGIGFGALTADLEAGWTAEALAELGPSLLTEYVALTDAQGGFVGRDWTSAVLFQWDPVTGELPQDEAGDLLPVVVPAEGPLPEAYVRSFPWWYEDLADLDLEAL